MTTDHAYAVMMFFLCLWLASGWYRIDCALKVEKACKLIEQEYIKKERP